MTIQESNKIKIIKENIYGEELSDIELFEVIRDYVYLD
mgnify:CR=1 FL=1